MRSFIYCISVVAMLLGLASASKAQDITCPVTKSVPITFQPVGAFANHSNNLLGTEKLFTLFPGNWHSLQRTERGYRVPKIVWGTNVVDLRADVGHSSLTLTRPSTRW
jgi:hypothetical protein